MQLTGEEVVELVRGLLAILAISRAVKLVIVVEEIWNPADKEEGRERGKSSVFGAQGGTFGFSLDTWGRRNGQKYGVSASADLKVGRAVC